MGYKCNRIQNYLLCHRLDFADETAMTSTPAFIIAFIVLIGIILIALICVCVIVGCLLEKMEMIVCMAMVILRRIMGVPTESKSRQYKLAYDE